MTTLKEEAQAYEPSQIKNIADLNEVFVDFDVKTVKRKRSDGEEYTLKLITVNGEDYRVPNSVLNDIKNILSIKPDLKRVKVTKKGTGLNTDYTVIPLE